MRTKEHKILLLRDQRTTLIKSTVVAKILVVVSLNKRPETI